MNNEIKKLTRSATDRKIAGVCGGIGEYLKVDSTVIRILFLMALLVFGGGGLAYLIVWLCAPDETELR
ncbi:MAG: PspC domain-containing protein [Bacteroidales bacterium]|nr:PspC domain-containing protein [Bacteroidales bacterium]